VAVTIRPPDSADLAALTGFLDGLSIRTRVQRFFAPVRATPAMVRRACGQAGAPGQAGPAGQTGAAGEADILLATHGNVIIGHAMAADRATAGESVTEIGVVVADAWQGQGVGSSLVRALLRRAQARGVTSLSMDVLPDNQQVLAMIAGHWAVARRRRNADCVAIQVELPSARPERVTPARAPLAG
jgi:ribosomal protein S18 acetylase RimI-like enzyme